MTTYQLTPTPTPQQIYDMRQAQLYPHNIRVFASREHWFKDPVTGASNDNPPPTGPGSMKLWRDNTAVSGPDGAWYIFLGPNEALNYFIPVLPYSGSDSSGDNRPSGIGLLNWVNFGILSFGAAGFYKTNAKYFTVIPTLTLKWIDKNEAARMNFAGTQPASVAPLGFLMADETGPIDFISGNRILGVNEARSNEKYTATFPKDMALGFDAGNVPIAFRYVEWKAPAAPPDSGSGNADFPVKNMTDDDLLEAVDGILGSPLPKKDRAGRMRKLFGR